MSQSPIWKFPYMKGPILGSSYEASYYLGPKLALCRLPMVAPVGDGVISPVRGSYEVSCPFQEPTALCPGRNDPMTHPLAATSP